MPKTLKSKDRWAEKHFDEIIDFLWKHREKICDEKMFPDGFDSPDYAGLPEKIINNLSCGFVDAIKETFMDMSQRQVPMSKDQFARMCGKYLYAE